jgi:hypothetical protein
MRRRLLIIAIFLLAGAVVNVAVAWGCALTINPFYGTEDSESVRDNAKNLELFVARWSRPGTTAVACVRDSWPFSFRAENEDPMALLDKWTGFREPTHEFESGATKIEQRFAHGCGWPKLSFWCETQLDVVNRELYIGPTEGGLETGLPPLESSRARGASHRRKAPRVLPLRLIWPGVIVNTMFYAAILWLLICGPFVIRRYARQRGGLCPACAYPMGESGVCTECGSPLPEHSSPPTSTVTEADVKDFLEVIGNWGPCE